MKFHENLFVGYSFKKLFFYFLFTKYYRFKYYLKHVLPNNKEFLKTKKLMNSKIGKKVFVFGNGPSMSQLDPEKISKLVQNDNYEVIALNSFMYSHFAKFIKPSYMLFSDPLDFIKVDESHPRLKRAISGKQDKKLAIKNNIPLIVPIQFYDYAKEKHGKVYFFNDCPDYFSSEINLLKPRPFKAWTGMKAISSAIYMGYSEIYICGFDYNHFVQNTVDEDNKVINELDHFYVSKERPNYVRETNGTFGEHLYDCSLTFIQHEKFKHKNIINLNKKSFIDCFPKNKKLDIYLTK